MVGRKLRVYADTSVFGGAFEEGFRDGSRKMFEAVREGRLELVISTIVRDEVADAPPEVRELFEEIRERAEFRATSAEALALQAAYLAGGVITERWAADALHVAIATIAGCAAIVSWNFKHIVNVRKAPLYSAISEVHGYPPITICSPPEVIEYAEDSGDEEV
jgi:predicted nucleic acid-binding protein